MKIVYLDCFSGIAGDMTLAALIDAGADKEYVEHNLSRLELESYSLQWNRVVKRGISALKLNVILDPANLPQRHRQFSEITQMIIKANLTEKATALAIGIFEKVAIAEAKIHDVPVDKVHFHEMGAVDSIVDIVGVALALDSMEVDKIISSPVPVGSGSIRIEHGLYPVPAPATLEILRGIPLVESNLRLELTTPTGAGIVSGVASGFNLAIPTMIVDSIGYGAGTRELPDQPNVLRVVVGHTESYLDKWHPCHDLHQVKPGHEHTHHHSGFHHAEFQHSEFYRAGFQHTEFQHTEFHRGGSHCAAE